MKIVVTGAYGQLGGELCRQLSSDAVPLEIDTLDLTDGPAVTETLHGVKPDAVINCAAYTQVDQAESESQACRAVNTTAVGHLARACSELDCPLVQISTDYVFGSFPSPRHAEHAPRLRLRIRPYREEDTPSPQGVYAHSKLDGERAAARHSKHLIVRTCGLYARPTDQRAKNFVNTMLRLGRSHEELRVVANQHCTPSYVPHVARAVLFLSGVTRSEPAPWGIYHITNRGATTWYDFAGEIFRQAEIEISLRPITTAEFGAAAPRPSYSILNTEKYHSLGGPAMPDWKSALAEYFSEYTI
jgi:dTDP-4-dehydrorhamnose reductase